MTKKHKLGLLIVLFVLNIVVFLLIWQKLDQRLMVAFLDVGQGDAIFIETPSGKQILIDGGPPDGTILRKLGEVMPFYDRSLDIVLATHPDEDHIGGLNDVLERYRIDLFIRNEATSSSQTFSNLLGLISDHKIPEKIITEAQVINFNDGVKFNLLFPNRDIKNEETNNSSIVGKLSYGEIDFLLTGDSPIPIERELIYHYGRFLESEVLKVGHHGSKYSTSEAYLDYVKPRFSIISAGLNNRYHHPNQEVIDNLEKIKTTILKTLGGGSLIFYTDGITLSPPPSLR